VCMGGGGRRRHVCANYRCTICAGLCQGNDNVVMSTCVPHPAFPEINTRVQQRAPSTRTRRAP
jgi:hypothetical protein